MFFNLKLKNAADSTETLKRLMGIVGIANIEKMFPGETDLETASFYLVHLDDNLCSVVEDRVFVVLSNDPDVEFVEKPARRKLCM